jgi:hypothetical protein
MPDLAFKPKMRKEDAFLKKLRSNIDPPSPAKPSEKAISIQIPKRRG